MTSFPPASSERRETGNASILDGNSFRDQDAHALVGRARDLVERRARVLGPGYRLFYRHPVELVRDGTEYLDMYNNVPAVGHAHPRVVEAVGTQMELLSTHTRYLHEAILNYADDLLSTFTDGPEQLVFVCTGSEANDLALRIGREYTGGHAYIATREAYHGNTALVSAHSPSLSGLEPMDPALRVVDPPDTYRYGSAEAAGVAFLDAVASAVNEIEASGERLAGIILDTSFSSDGIFTGAPGMIRQAVDLVRARGGIVIADEVQPGFARTGETFWGYQRHGIAVDIVTTGKPMGNGYPVAALAARSDVLAAFARHRPYFNTFGGNPVAIAAAQAVLEVIRSEGLQTRAFATGNALRSGLQELARMHPAIGDVRGTGLYTGVELVLDRVTGAPDPDLALGVIEDLRARGVLTSVCGPDNNVLKLRPPLAFTESDIPQALEAFDASLARFGA